MAMDNDPSSSGQHVQISTSTHEDVGDGEKPTVSHHDAKTNGHADTGLNKALESLSPDAIEIERSLEEPQETVDGSGTRGVRSDDEDGQQDVKVDDKKPNVCYSHLSFPPEHLETQEDVQGSHAVNEHIAPSDHVPNHDTGEQQSKLEPITSATVDVSSPYFRL